MPWSILGAPGSTHRATMTSAERADLESRADRYRRRGELARALELYRRIHAAFPADEGVGQKIAAIEETSQPDELALPPTAGAEPLTDSGVPLTAEQEGERLYALGDYVGAAAAYRRALDLRPDSELVRERLFEIFRVAQTAPRHSALDRALPRDRRAILSALLDRISSRKRLPLRTG
jgi:tetratricopeptide (TPR) repeat protein